MSREGLLSKSTARFRRDSPLHAAFPETVCWPGPLSLCWVQATITHPWVFLQPSPVPVEGGWKVWIELSRTQSWSPVVNKPGCPTFLS